MGVLDTHYLVIKDLSSHGFHGFESSFFNFAGNSNDPRPTKDLPNQKTEKPAPRLHVAFEKRVIILNPASHLVKQVNCSLFEQPLIFRR